MAHPVDGNEPNVSGLVYVAAYAPDAGENIADLKAHADPAAGAAHVRSDDKGYLWIERSAYPEFFAGDVKPEEARVMAAVQTPWKVSSSRIVTPAWRSRPSWYQAQDGETHRRNGALAQVQSGICRLSSRRDR